MLLNQPSDMPKLFTTMPAATLESNRQEPEPGDPELALDVDVRRLVPVASMKEEAVLAYGQARGHRFLILRGRG